MGIKIKNLQTGEFEKFNIPALKGEKGEPGEIEPSEKVDYIGKQHSKLRDTMNANVDYIIKTAIGEFNYLDYEGQHITATNSIEGHAKSAILKGQTLVNISTQKSSNTFTFQSAYNGATPNRLVMAVAPANGRILTKPSTRYIVKFTVSNYINNYGGSVPITILDYDIHSVVKTTQVNGNGDYYIIGVTKETFGYEGRILIKSNATLFENNTETKVSLTISNIMVIEYQQGMENWDIPYFEGMQSVKMPVLTTTGKNLCNRVRGYHSNTGGTQNSWASFDMSCKPNTTYTAKIFSGSNNRFGFFSGVGVVGSTDSYKVTGGNFTPYTGGEKTFTITTGNNDNVMWVYLDNNSIVSLDDVVVQVEESPTATTYEPFKSNILSTSEEVVLRGIGDIQDTLDCLTGEVTERISEIVFDGSENWVKPSSQPTNTSRFLLVDFPNNKNAKILSNIRVKKNAGEDNLGIWCDTNTVLNVDTSVDTVESLKVFLSKNPINLQYSLATESIKTVDLSDNHVYSYKDVTHYNCSSAEGSLVPTLSVKVPTDTQLTIQEQKATTQTLLIKNMDLQQSIKEVQAMNLAFNTALYNSFNSIREEVEDIKKHVSTNENLEGSF